MSNTPPVSGLNVIADLSATLRVPGQIASSKVRSQALATSMLNRHVSGGVPAVDAAPRQIDHRMAAVNLTLPCALCCAIPRDHSPWLRLGTPAQDDDLIAAAVKGTRKNCPNLSGPTWYDDFHCPRYVVLRQRPMFLARRPSAETIQQFLRDSRDLPLSYEPVGILSLGSTGRNVDELTIAIGRGPADFARARAALIAWKQFDIGWVEAHPPNAPVVAGTVVAVLIRHLGFWSLNGCRVVYGAGSPTDGTRFGYAYGTLTNHAEAGEELFEIFIDPATEIVSYHIRATSWPRATLAKLGQPIVRTLQARFRSHSGAAMKRVVANR